MAVRSLADLKPMETRVMKVVTLKNIPNVPAEGAAERTAGRPRDADAELAAGAHLV